MDPLLESLVWVVLCPQKSDPRTCLSAPDLRVSRSCLWKALTFAISWHPFSILMFGKLNIASSPGVHEVQEKQCLIVWLSTIPVRVRLQKGKPGSPPGNACLQRAMERICCQQLSAVEHCSPCIKLASPHVPSQTRLKRCLKPPEEEI